MEEEKRERREEKKEKEEGVGGGGGGGGCPYQGMGPAHIGRWARIYDKIINNRFFVVDRSGAKGGGDENGRCWACIYDRLLTCCVGCHSQ